MFYLVEQCNSKYRPDNKGNVQCIGRVPALRYTGNSTQRKVPARLVSGSAADIMPPESVEDYFRRIYLEAVDTIVNCIRDRFDQEGYKIYSKLQQLLLKTCNQQHVDEELLKFVCDFYGEDLRKGELRVQLETLGETMEATAKQSEWTLPEVVDHMRGLSFGNRELLSQVCTLVKLILVMPATNAVSERSFSAMKRVKSYLRSTMTQQRLNHLMILHVHKDYADRLNLVDAANEFTSAKDHRRSVFGTFH